jgi:hypothetical protein
VVLSSSPAEGVVEVSVDGALVRRPPLPFPVASFPLDGEAVGMKVGSLPMLVLSLGLVVGLVGVIFGGAVG